MGKGKYVYTGNVMPESDDGISNFICCKKGIYKGRKK